MKTNVNGFYLEVTVTDGLPLVRIASENGTVIINTDAVSVTGLKKLPKVFGRAARMAAKELELYYHRLHTEVEAQLAAQHRERH